MYVTRDAAHIVVPWQASLAQIIPHAREVTHDGARLLVIPNAADEARLCRNLGVAVPPPIMTTFLPARRRPTR